MADVFADVERPAPVVKKLRVTATVRRPSMRVRHTTDDDDDDEMESQL